MAARSMLTATAANRVRRSSSDYPCARLPVRDTRENEEGKKPQKAQEAQKEFLVPFVFFFVPLVLLPQFLTA